MACLTSLLVDVDFIEKISSQKNSINPKKGWKVMLRLVMLLFLADSVVQVLHLFGINI